MNVITILWEFWSRTKKKNHFFCFCLHFVFSFEFL